MKSNLFNRTVNRNYVIHENHHLKNVIGHRFLFTIIILAVCSNAIDALADTRMLPSNETDCTSRRTCAQCTRVTACEWSFENQTCVAPDQRVPAEGFSGKSCPDIKVTNSISNSLTRRTKIIIKLEIPKVEERVTRCLRGQEIECEIDGRSNATAFKEDGSIACHYELPAAFYDRVAGKASAPNPLSIVYFTIVVNGVRWRFDDGRDHYVALYPYGRIYRGKSCAESSTCTVGFWDDRGPDVQVYCKWCLDNRSCTVKRQEGGCTARNTSTGAPPFEVRGNSSRVFVRDDNVSVERFSPSTGPLTRDTTVRVAVRGHTVLAEHRDVTVTVAGRACRDPRTLADGRIQCTVVVAGTTADARDDTGPVVVSYRSSHEPQDYVLVSADAFRFARPRVASVEGPKCGLATGAGAAELSVRGEFLNLPGTEVTVSLGGRAECAVIERLDDRVVCRTGGGGGEETPGTRPLPLPLPVDVSVDGVHCAYGPPFAFRLLDAEPSVDANQSLAGFASGGTRLTVRGRGLECAVLPVVYAVRDDGTTEYGGSLCAVSSGAAAAALVCRAPKLPDALTATGPVRLRIGFKWVFHGHTVDSVLNPYAVSPDPVFTHFRVGPTAAEVTIHGRNVDGLRADDVTVRVPGPSDGGGECVVYLIDRTRITCRAASRTSVEDADELLIAVGMNLTRTVRRKRDDVTVVPDDVTSVSTRDASVSTRDASASTRDASASTPPDVTVDYYDDRVTVPVVRDHVPLVHDDVKVDDDPLWLMVFSTFAYVVLLLAVALTWKLKTGYERRRSMRCTTELKNIVAGIGDD